MLNDADANDKNSNELAVYVSSYDGSSDLWGPFFDLFQRFWPDCDFRVYLVNNQLPYEREGVDVLSSGKEIDWFDRTLRTLRQVDSEYVMFLLEDYFLSKTVRNADVHKIIETMRRDDVFYYRLSLTSGAKPSDDGEPIKIRKGSSYSISLQPAIWNRAALIKALEEIDGKTPWDFEYYFNDIHEAIPSAEDDAYIAGVLYDTRDILGYKNGVLRGRWIPETLNHYKRMGIRIDEGNRERLSVFDEAKYRLSDYLSRHMGEGVKSKIKLLLERLHIRYI